MDPYLPPIPDEPWAGLSPPIAPPPEREPAWTGLDVVMIIIFTALAMVTVSVLTVLAGAILTQAGGWHFGAHPEVQVVAVTLIGQTGGMLAGLLFAWLWITRVRNADFIRAIHWRRLSPEIVLAMLAGGFATMIGVQVLSHILPMPPGVPMDKLFTPYTAWMLVFYGVAIAPFFEEFFFRGLIYPSLRASFQAGISHAEIRAWRPLVRLLGATTALAAIFWHWRMQVIGNAVHPRAMLALGAAGLVALALPVVPLAIAGWIINGLARWRHPELLAILITGTLFGLMHAAQLGWAWAAVLILVLVGVLLTVVRATTGSLMSSWLFHCAYNGTLFIAQFISTQGFHHFQGMF